MRDETSRCFKTEGSPSYKCLNVLLKWCFIVSYRTLSYGTGRIAISVLNCSLFCLDIWQCRDEHNNFQQKFDAELVKEAKRFGFSAHSIKLDVSHKISSHKFYCLGLR